MYNRYLNTSYGADSCPEQEISAPPPCDPEPPCAPPPPPPPPHSGKSQGGKPQEGGGLLSGLNEALTGRLKNLHFDLDTLVIIIAIYFLLADTEDFDTDLLILIGVMFIIGF